MNASQLRTLGLVKRNTWPPLDVKLGFRFCHRSTMVVLLAGPRMRSKSTTSLHGGTALAVPAGMLKSQHLRWCESI